MSSVFSPREKSRTAQGKTLFSVRKFTFTPRSGEADAGGSQRWQWLTIELLESAAFTTLSANASRAFFRIVIKHVSHAALGMGSWLLLTPNSSSTE